VRLGATSARTKQPGAPSPTPQPPRSSPTRTTLPHTERACAFLRLRVLGLLVLLVGCFACLCRAASRSRVGLALGAWRLGWRLCLTLATAGRERRKKERKTQQRDNGEAGGESGAHNSKEGQTARRGLGTHELTRRPLDASLKPTAWTPILPVSRSDCNRAYH
jgi:hypothetical protein